MKNKDLLRLAVCAFGLWACGDTQSPASNQDSTEVGPDLTDDTCADCSPDDTTTADTSDDASGSDVPDLDVPPGDTTGDAPADLPEDVLPDPPTGDLPCAVQTILEDNCTSCHAAEPLFGSPMPLVTLQDLYAPALSNPARRVVDLTVERIHSDRAPMPPAPAERLSELEAQVLTAWLESGAPAGDACADADVVDDTPDTVEDATPDAVEDTAPDVTEDTVDADTAEDTTPVEPECDWEVEFLANAGGGLDDTTPFTVPTSSNHYECFYFNPGWEGDAQALKFSSVIDDERVVHHWLLYAETNAGTPGTSRDCSGSHADATLIAGWAPGGDDWVMPEGVGMQLPGDKTYFIEIHYSNPRRLDTTDRSGVRVCGTDTPQPNVAGTHWLGTETILLLGGGSHDVTGTCTPDMDEPAHIVKSWPHMHTNGVRMESTIIRADGSRELLIDTPFQFDNQISHDTPFTIFPGDRITTTCHYETSGGLVTFGPNTEQEMCYNFVVAWPVGSFNTGGGIRGGSDNFCLR